MQISFMKVFYSRVILGRSALGVTIKSQFNLSLKVMIYTLYIGLYTNYMM